MSLEHAKIIDPIAQDIASLREQIKTLTETVGRLEGEAANAKQPENK